MRGHNLRRVLTTASEPGDRARLEVVRVAASRGSMPLQVSVRMPPA